MLSSALLFCANFLISGSTCPILIALPIITPWYFFRLIGSVGVQMSTLHPLLISALAIESAVSLVDPAFVPTTISTLISVTLVMLDAIPSAKPNTKINSMVAITIILCFIVAVFTAWL